MDHQRDCDVLSRKCLQAMTAKGLTFKSLAANIGLSPFVTTAALLGQMQLPEAAAAKAAAALDLPEATSVSHRDSDAGVTWSLGPQRSDNLSIL